MSKPQSEDELTTWLRRRCPAIGDDAAFLRPGRDLALSTDSQREGVHFEPGAAPDDVGRRLLAVNLSDLAAVGAEPKQALCTLASPVEWDRHRFFQGLLSACEDFGVELIGGDLSKATEVHASLTILGERYPYGRFLERSAARPGQRVWLAGFLGESHLGLKLIQADHSTRQRISAHESVARAFERSHRLPTPQLALGRWLAQRRSPIAAIDISDGLALDAQRLARASGIDISFSQRALAKTSSDPDTFAEIAAALGVDGEFARLAGGEDYALLFTADDSLTKELHKIGKKLPILQIGQVRRGRGRCMIRLDTAGGDREVPCEELLPAQVLGWDHLR